LSQQKNPFLQHAINHGQALIAEVNKAKSLSQDIVSNCDNVVMAINSGNIQNAINSIQNIRNMASQVSQSTQFFNQAINERLDMSSYVLNSIQHKINEVSGAIQSLRGNSNNYQLGWNQYGTQQPNQYGYSMPQQGQQQGQYGSSSVPQ
jgi:hypothetical protein